MKKFKQLNLALIRYYSKQSTSNCRNTTPPLGMGRFFVVGRLLGGRQHNCARPCEIVPQSGVMPQTCLEWPVTACAVCRWATWCAATRNSQRLCSCGRFLGTGGRIMGFWQVHVGYELHNLHLEILKFLEKLSMEYNIKNLRLCCLF